MAPLETKLIKSWAACSTSMIVAGRLIVHETPLRKTTTTVSSCSVLCFFCWCFLKCSDCMEILLTFAGKKQHNMHHLYTPGKINMKPKKKRVWKMTFLFLKGVMFFQFHLRFLESFKKHQSQGAPISGIHPPTTNKSNPMIGTYKEGLQQMCFFNIGRWLPVVFQMTFKEKSEETTKTQITANLKFSTSPN